MVDCCGGLVRQRPRPSETGRGEERVTVAVHLFAAVRGRGGGRRWAGSNEFQGGSAGLPCVLQTPPYSPYMRSERPRGRRQQETGRKARRKTQAGLAGWVLPPTLHTVVRA
jgi:hypothetical protein